MRYFIDLAYRGAPFHGWQIQPGDVSVQGTLEQALGVLLRQPVPVVGAGRTDAGVNARLMVAHVDLPDGFDPCAGTFLRSLNSLTGPDIAIFSFRPVAPDAHARFDATEREYRYFVHTRKDPFAGGLSWQAPADFDFEAMNRAGSLLLGRRDFSSFAKLHTDVKTNICHIKHARWVQVGPDYWRFEITADRFLRNMVRAIVGTLLDVGRGRLDLEGFRKVITEENRCRAGESVPAHGLSLVDVAYDDVLGDAREMGSTESTAAAAMSNL